MEEGLAQGGGTRLPRGEIFLQKPDFTTFPNTCLVSLWEPMGLAIVGFVVTLALTWQKERCRVAF